jgi:hypothetical protein
MFKEKSLTSLLALVVFILIPFAAFAQENSNYDLTSGSPNFIIGQEPLRNKSVVAVAPVAVALPALSQSGHDDHRSDHRRRSHRTRCDLV